MSSAVAKRRWLAAGGEDPLSAARAAAPDLAMGDDGPKPPGRWRACYGLVLELDDVAPVRLKSPLRSGDALPALGRADRSVTLPDETRHEMHDQSANAGTTGVAPNARGRRASRQ